MPDQQSELEEALPDFRMELLKVLSDIQIQLQAVREVLTDIGVKPERYEEEYHRLRKQSHRFLGPLAERIPHAHE